jgi:DegV family protein with EDD domain
MPRTWYEKNGVKYIVMKRIIAGRELCECFDADRDFDEFYEGLKKGECPSTTALNPFELKEYFEKILKETSDADIIHTSLSSGLSATCNNAMSAAREVNKSLEAAQDPRRVYVIDTLIATLAQGQMVDELVNLRNAGAATIDAVKKIEELREHQQAWVIVSDLFHLKRGGRISGAKAAIGSVLNIRPIIHLSQKGKLAMESKMRGNQKAVKYLLSRMEKFGEKYCKDNNLDFFNQTIWVARTSKNEITDLLLASVKSQYPKMKIRTGIVGPIIGTHLGCGGAGLLFIGAPRLDIE